MPRHFFLGGSHKSRFGLVVIPLWLSSPPWIRWAGAKKQNLIRINSRCNWSCLTCETSLTHLIRTRSFDGSSSIKSWCTIMMLLHSLHRPVCSGCPTMATRFGHLQDFPSSEITGRCLGSFASDPNQPAGIDWQPYLDGSVNQPAMTGNWFDSNNWILSGAGVMVHSAEVLSPPFLPEERPKRPKCSESSGNPKARLILSFQKEWCFAAR